MALNRSLGAGTSGRRIGSAPPRASGIPSALKITKLSENSCNGSIKVGALQLNDGNVTDGVSPGQRSLTRERTSIPGKVVGNGGESDSKPSVKSVPSTGVLSLSSTNGVAKTLAKAAQRPDRNSPRISGPTDETGVNVAEGNCRSESASKLSHPSSLPLALSSPKVERSISKASTDHPNTAVAGGLPTSKHLPPGSSIGGKGVLLSNVSKVKSPSLSCRIAPEADGKTDPHIQKTTGIAKLQNPASLTRPLGGTNLRPRSSPGGSSIPSSRVPLSSGPSAGSSEISANLSSGGKIDESGQKDSRTKTGCRSNNSVSTLGSSRKTASTAKIPKLNAMNNMSSRKKLNHELQSVLHSSKTSVSKNCDAIENASELEYFCETKSTTSDDINSLCDDNISLDLSAMDIEAESLSVLRESLEASTARLNASNEDIFASCEDIVCEPKRGNKASLRNANLISGSKTSAVLVDNDENSDLLGNKKSKPCVIDEVSIRDNETELFIVEDTFANRLPIMEDRLLDCDSLENRPAADSIVSAATKVTDTVLPSSGNCKVMSTGKLATDIDNSKEYYGLKDIKLGSGVGFELDNKTSKARDEIEVSLNDQFSADNMQPSCIAVSVRSFTEKNTSLNSVEQALGIKGISNSETQFEDGIDARNTGGGHFMRTSDESSSIESQCLLSESSKEDRRNGSCFVDHRFGADRMVDSEEESNPNCTVRNEGNYQGTYLAAADATSGEEDKMDDAVGRDQDQSGRIVLGDSCETLIGDSEGCVDAQVYSGSDAAGMLERASMNKDSKWKHFGEKIADGSRTDLQCKSAYLAKSQKHHGHVREPDVQSIVTTNSNCKNSSCIAEDVVSNDFHMSTLLLNPEKQMPITNNTSEDEAGEKGQIVGQQLSSQPEFNFPCDNHPDVPLDVIKDAKIRNNSTAVSKQCRGDGSDGQLLSACFIKAFSAWLPDDAAESDSKHVPGQGYKEPNEDIYDQSSRASNELKEEKSNLNMSRKKDLRLIVPVRDESNAVSRKETRPTTGTRKVNNREKFNLAPDSFSGEEGSLAQVGSYAYEPNSSSTLTEFKAADQPESQLVVKAPNSMPPTTSSKNPADQRCTVGISTKCSSVNPVHSGADSVAYQSVPQSTEHLETMLIQNVKEVVHPHVSNDPGAKCKVKVEKENCSNKSSNEASVIQTAENKAKDLEAKSTINSSVPLSMSGLCFGSSAKEFNHSVYRAPSPLRVLTDPCHSTDNEKDAPQNFQGRRATISSEIPHLSKCQFHPIAVKDVDLNDSSNAARQNLEMGKKLESVPDKVIKDANHNVIGKTGIVPATACSDLAVSLEGFMSPKYVPSRPLSQICARTMGKSLLQNMDGIDGSNKLSLTSMESLPAVDSDGAEGKAKVLDQIHLARSCSRIGLAKSPVMTLSDDVTGQSCATPRLPVAASLPSFDLYHSALGKTLKPGTPSHLSQTCSSRLSLCNTPSIREGSSPFPSLARASMFEIFNQDTSRNGTPLPRHHEDVHGSAVSLSSMSSSLYSASMDEKQTIEMRKLRLELETAKETILSLKTQLSVNALMTKTYEQNIEGLTQRLKQLTTIIDQKESELCDLRPLKNASTWNDRCGSSGLQTIPDSTSGVSSLHRKASYSASLPYDARSAGLKHVPVLTRHISCESVNSLNSQSSSCSMGSQQSATLHSETKKKRNWIRSSFSKAFSRKKSKSRSAGEPDSLSLQSDNSANDALAMVESQVNFRNKSSPSDGPPISSDGIVTELEEKLREADRRLTDLRLDSLASIQHVEHLQETISCLEQQVATLKAENKTLQHRLLEQGTSPSGTPVTSNQNQKRLGDLIRHGSLRSTSPGTTTPSSGDCLSRPNVSKSHEMSSPKLLQRFSLVDAMASDASCDQLRRIIVLIMNDSFGGEVTKLEEDSKKSRQIGVLMLSEQTGWQDLDMQLCSLFVDHIHILDPDAGLGLDEKSIASYQLGNQERIPYSKMPEIFPSKVLSAANASIKIRLRDWQDDCVDFLAFDTLVPKPLLIQYVSLLTENRRLLFCGPNLSGKTFLAKKLARHLVLRKEKRLSSISVAHFTVDSKSSKELQQYLSNIVSHCEQGSDRLPSVIVIDNLHLADNLSKAFSGFFSLSSQLCPYLIGTMTQSRAASITCLQFHQNFRWVLFSLTEEPVKSFLARFLHRQWAEKQFRQSGSEDGDCGLLRVVDWMSKVWQHINRFVAAVYCPDKCIGPGIFLPCPMDVDKARTWFVDLWNYSIGPYLLQLIKDSSIPGGSNRAAHEDPTDWVLETSPWESSKCRGSEARDFPLRRLFPYGDSPVSREQNQMLSTAGNQILQNSSSHSDPLLDMLLHLQVTSCYTECNTTPTTNTFPNHRFTALSANSPKMSANLNSLHSAAL